MNVSEAVATRRTVRAFLDKPVDQAVLRRVLECAGEPVLFDEITLPAPLFKGLTRARLDAYGGSIDNRARFLNEVMQAVVAEIGGGRTGIRLSPVTPANDASDNAPQPLFEHVVRQLAPPLSERYTAPILGGTQPTHSPVVPVT